MGLAIHQCIFFASTFVNLPESVKIFTATRSRNGMLITFYSFISLNACEMFAIAIPNS